MPEPDDTYKVNNAADYVGTYTSPDGRKIVLTAEGTLLKLAYKGEQIPLEVLAPDNFYVSHPDFALFPLSFERAKEDGPVAEASYGSDWYAGERYSGPRTFEAPPDLQAFAGHYRNENPWEGSFRVVLRKGRLWLGGDPLVALGPGLFRLGEEEHEPNRLRFEDVVNGKALRASVSGTEYRRIET
jgi:hypothetical protein